MTQRRSDLGAAPRRPRHSCVLGLALILSPVSVLSACASTATTAPDAPEIVEPGDIPDNQAFVAFTPSGMRFAIQVPEGWARTSTPTGGFLFTDKYNSISVETAAVSAEPSAVPTVGSVTSSGLSDVTADPTFKMVDVEPVTRHAGEGVLARFEIGSAPNPVTGKVALLAVERYVFAHAGTRVVLTLSGAKGADNVDPWKIVSNSLTWAE